MKSVWSVASLLGLFLVGSCGQERYWSSPGGGDCNPARLFSKQSEIWKATFGSAKSQNSAVGCLRLSARGEIRTRLVRLTEGGELQALSGARDPVAVDMQARDGIAFRVFVYGLSLQGDSTAQQRHCSQEVSRADYRCGFQASGSCWFGIQFWPKASGGAGKACALFGEKSLPEPQREPSDGGPEPRLETAKESPGERPEGGCRLGQERSCYTGPPATRNKGDCKDGKQSCQAGGWGLCEGEIKPLQMPCAATDSDCDGSLDRSGCVSTYAGPVSQQYQLDGDALSSGWLFLPYGVAYDPRSKAIYIADTYNYRIRKLVQKNGRWELSTVAGTGLPGRADGKGDVAQFNTPAGIAVDPKSGDIYVTEIDNNSLRKIDPTGHVSTPITAVGIQGIKLSRPLGLAFAPDGSLYIADSGHHAIRKYDPASGSLTTYAGIPDASGAQDGLSDKARFNQPSGLAVDGKGVVFVADSGNHMIRVIFPDLGIGSLVGHLAGLNECGKDFSKQLSAACLLDGKGKNARFFWPAALLHDGQKLFVADTFNSRIRSVDAGTMEVRFFAGNDDYKAFSVRENKVGKAGKDGRFFLPWGLSAYTPGKALVADTYNNQIKILDLSTGETELIAGSGLAGYEDGKSAHDARFMAPAGLALADDGKLYVTDSYAHRVRVIEPPAPGQVARVRVLTGIGLPIATYSGDLQHLHPHRYFFHSPASLAFLSSAKKQLLVSEAGAHRIRRYNFATSSVHHLAGALKGEPGYKDSPTPALVRFRLPYGMFVDDKGDRVYIADASNHCIRAYGPRASSPTVTAAWGRCAVAGLANGPPKMARFQVPSDIVQDSKGSFFISDTGNHMIRRVSFATGSPVVESFAGSGKPGYADGAGGAAQFHFPLGLSIDAQDNLYVADAGNHSIRKITPRGLVSTFAGSPRPGFRDGPRADARFRYPVEVLWDPKQGLFVADMHNHRVRLISK